MNSHLLVGSVILGLLLSSGTRAAAAAASLPDNDEVATLYSQDQADRQPKPGAVIDWAVVSPRDHARQKRVMELYSSGQLRTGADFYHAGMILQHGSKPEDFLLCHELCIAAVFKAGPEDGSGWVAGAKWLAAASEDRFLESIGRSQRFGTQFRKPDGGEWHLGAIEEGVTDDLRKAWNVPPLAEAKKRAAALNRK